MHRVENVVVKGVIVHYEGRLLHMRQNASTSGKGLTSFGTKLAIQSIDTLFSYLHPERKLDTE